MKLHTVCLVLSIAAACGKSDHGAASASSDERPAPWKLTFHGFDRKATISPRNDPSDAHEPAPGKLFECVQYLAVNVGTAPETTPSAKLTDGTTTYDADASVVAFYAVGGDWAKSSGLDPVPVGGSSQETSCFQVPESAPLPNSLVFVDTGWGNTQGWHASLTIPAKN